jgi:hypothetical protein
MASYIRHPSARLKIQSLYDLVCTLPCVAFLPRAFAIDIFPGILATGIDGKQCCQKKKTVFHCGRLGVLGLVKYNAVLRVNAFDIVHLTPFQHNMLLCDSPDRFAKNLATATPVP